MLSKAGQTIHTSLPIGEIVQSPWTHNARQRALDHEVMAYTIAYVGRAMQSRNWSPWHNLPLAEMEQLGHRLSPETIHLIEGFFGVEEYVGDYVQESLAVFHHNWTRRHKNPQRNAFRCPSTQASQRPSANGCTST